MEDPGTAVNFRERAKDKWANSEGEEIDAKCKVNNGWVNDVVVSCDGGETRRHHRAGEGAGKQC